MSITSSRRNSTASSNLPPSPSLTSQSSNGKSLSTTPPSSKPSMRSPKSNNLTIGSPLKFSSTRRCSSARYKSGLTNSSGSISPSGSFRGRRTSMSGEPMSREEEIACYMKFRKTNVGSVSLANIFIDEGGSSSRESKGICFL